MDFRQVREHLKTTNLDDLIGKRVMIDGLSKPHHGGILVGFVLMDNGDVEAVIRLMEGYAALYLYHPSRIKLR